jgi:3'-5' exoribonuclease
MSRRYVNQLANGDSVDEPFLVVDKQLRANRQGNLYLHLELRDKTGAVGARMWNASEDLARRFEPGDLLHVKGKTQVFQGSLQIILSHLEVVDPATVEPGDFMPQSSQNVTKLLSRLRELLMAMSNPHLRALVECFLIDDAFVRKFTTAPAGIKNHHAYQGGLIEHVVSLLNVADRITGLYPELDRDLLLTGIFLHDVGKIDELAYDRAFVYTDVGQLVGHLVMGVEMLSEKVAESAKLTGEPFPTELLLRLKHMIVSHHGTHEFGSPKVPMTLEAIALHYLDNLDAKIHTFGREIRDDPSRGSSWTPFQQSLGRRLYKGSTTGDAAGDPDAEPRDGE